MAVYCATKAYVLSLGEAIAYELRGSGDGDDPVPRPDGNQFRRRRPCRPHSALRRFTKGPS